MVETWAIVDSRDEVLARCEEGAECSDADQELIGGVPPYRVVHLVEAGTVEPELAEVVKAVHDYLRDECFNMEPVDRAFCALKPHQLRACGIEVEA